MINRWGFTGRGAATDRDYPSEVKAAADAVQARGEYPTTPRVRAQMGGGRSITITSTLKFLVEQGEVILIIPPGNTAAGRRLKAERR